MNARTETKQPRPDKEAQQRKLQDNLAAVHHRWLVLSGKGGVGKSTVATSLAMALAARKTRVGIVDVDIHGPNVPKMLGVDGQPLRAGEDGMEPVCGPLGIKVISMDSLLPNPDTPVVWRGPMKMNAIRQFLSDVTWGEIDHLVVDAPPGTGDEPMSVAQLLGHVDGAIIVTTPQDVALLDSRKCVVFAKELGIPVAGIVENMSGMICPHCGKEVDLFGSGGGQVAARELVVPFLGAIPFDPGVVRGGDQGRPPVRLEPEQAFSKAFATIVNKLVAPEPPEAGMTEE